VGYQLPEPSGHRVQIEFRWKLNRIVSGLERPPACALAEISFDSGLQTPGDAAIPRLPKKARQSLGGPAGGDSLTGDCRGEQVDRQSPPVFEIVGFVCRRLDWAIISPRPDLSSKPTLSPG
jgi:hypothetical protein